MKVLKEWNFFGLLYIETAKDIYNIEFWAKTMTIRNEEQSIIKVLSRDRSLNPKIEDIDAIYNFISSVEISK